MSGTLMSSSHAQLAPTCLINAEGQAIYGQFDGIPDALGVKKFAYYNEMDKRASWLKKHFDYKQFQFVNIVTPRYIIGVAIAGIRYVGSSFCYFYDTEKNQLTEIKCLKPLSLGYKMSPSPMFGVTNIKFANNVIEFKLIEGQWQLTIDSADIQAQLNLTPPPLSLPMSLCSPTGYSGWTYTQKHNALSVHGKLTIKDEPQPLNLALASYDFSAGFMRRETSWRWACINAQLPQGKLGLNLAAGVNETGNNENVMWINGQRHFLGAANFEFNRQLSPDYWQISTLDGRVDLTFRALNCRSEKINLGFLKSNFRQNIGYFSGDIIDGNGVKYHLNNHFGLTEDHFAKW
jgi:hypothetical protein